MQPKRKGGSLRGFPFSSPTTVDTIFDSASLISDLWEEIRALQRSLVVNDSELSKSQTKLGGGSSISSLQSHSGDGIGSGVGRAAGWAVGFERLLEDRAGLATFTEFLKKEFSEENILFWTACEEYKAIPTQNERKSKAAELFEKHLSTAAPEPVNVDSQARQVTSRGLPEGAVDLFSTAQTQIFRLMKQDSYPRFLKSDLYKQCVVAEMEGRPLPYDPTMEKTEEVKKVKFLDDSISSTSSSSDRRSRFGQILKKSRSVSSTEEGGEEKRRKSLLPWARNKSEKQRLAKVTTDPEPQKQGHKAAPDSQIRGSLDLADLSQMSKEVVVAPKDTAITKEEKPEEMTMLLMENNGNISSDPAENKFCRVALPDGSTTVIYARSGQTIQTALGKLCDRRNLHMPAMDVFYLNTEKLVDTSKDISTLGSKEIQLERRILIRLDMPNRKVIGIKAKPNRTVRDVFRPILNKYGYKLETMVIHMTGAGVMIDQDALVSTVDNSRLSVQSVQDFAGIKKKFKEWGGFGTHRSQGGKPPLPRSKSVATDPNQLLNDLLDGRSEAPYYFDELGILDPERKFEDKKTDESRSSGLFGFIRRNSVGEKDGNKVQKIRVRATSQPGTNRVPQKPEVPIKPEIGGGGEGGGGGGAHERAPNKNRDPEEERFFELLSRVQSHRLDDQRGLTAADLELPEFLKVGKDGKERQLNESQKIDMQWWRARRDRRNSDSSLLETPDVRQTSRSMSQEQIDSPHPRLPDTPGSHHIPYADQSFSQDGVVPSHREAENYFCTATHSGDATNYDDSCLMERSLNDIGLGNRVLANDAQYPHPGVPQRSTTPLAKLPARLSPRAKTPTNVSSQNPASKSHVQSDHVMNTTLLSASGIDLDSTMRAVSSSTDKMSSSETLSQAQVTNHPSLSVGALRAKGHTEVLLNNPRVPPRRTNPGGSAFTWISSSANQTATLPAGPVRKWSESPKDMTGLTPSSTPSPTTHDLVLDTDSPDLPSSPNPPPRPPRRPNLPPSPPDGDNSAKKSLSFDSGSNPSELADRQVSYV